MAVGGNLKIVDRKERAIKLVRAMGSILFPATHPCCAWQFNTKPAKVGGWLMPLGPHLPLYTDNETPEKCPVLKLGRHDA